VTEPSFREAAESDAAILLQFMRQYYAFDGHSFDDERTPRALTALLSDRSLGKVWLILDDAAPIGYVAVCYGYSLEWLGRDAFIDEFFLLEQYRGQGWGRKTLAFVEEAARSCNIRTLHLEVVQQNAAALEIYRKLGFHEHKSRFMSKWIARGPQQG